MILLYVLCSSSWSQAFVKNCSQGFFALFIKIFGKGIIIRANFSRQARVRILYGKFAGNVPGNVSYSSNYGFFVEVNLQNLWVHPPISANIKISQILYISSDNRIFKGHFISFILSAQKSWIKRFKNVMIHNSSSPIQMHK